jgi:hypothetical protein
VFIKGYWFHNNFPKTIQQLYNCLFYYITSMIAFQERHNQIHSIIWSSQAIQNRCVGQRR